MISNIGKNQFKHQGYNHILDLVETHSNITSSSEEHSVEVSARHYPSYE